MSNLNRREIFRLSVMSLVALATGRSWSQPLADFILINAEKNPGNFHFIYSDPRLKNEFLLFLKNVYNIYPEDKFHQLLSEGVQKSKTDEEVYNYVLTRLSSIKPFLSELSYALPALKNQKAEISQQTMRLIGKRSKINGYMEIGTPGRYIDELENHIKIEGDIFLVNETKPSYSPVDIVERGQLTPIGDFIPLNDYESIAHSKIKENSLDVVTNYIGFHHCPLPKLDTFIGSIHTSLRKGGSLVLRDHDVIDPEMNAIVSLAHDVFNCGLKENWDRNHQELRHFRSLKEWIAILKDKGFQYTGTAIYQDGDPTKNALMEFIKT